MPDKKDVEEAIKKIMDPELNLDIWTLGLIYDINIKNDSIKIDMTFTSPMCPFGPQLVEQVKVNLEEIGFKEPNINIVFDPVWEPSDDVKMLLGIL